jgi:hypothetical protein
LGDIPETGLVIQWYYSTVDLSAGNLFAQILFGAIGLGAFIYGKKQSSFKAMLLGVAISAFPYVVSETWMLYAIGSALTALLFVWKD